MGASRKGLSVKQERFVNLVATGQHSNAECYRIVYDVSEGSNPNTAIQEASRLLANPYIAARLEARLKQIARAQLASALSLREKVLAQWVDAMDNGERENGSLRASELLAKHLGMLNQTLTIEEGSQNSAEILEELDALLDSSASESAKSLENNEKMPSDSSVH
jgi:hypothetical protein